MSLNVGPDIEYQMSLIKKEAGETDVELAQRLYSIQCDVYAANAGTDIAFRSFWGLSEAEIESWIEKAKTYK